MHTHTLPNTRMCIHMAHVCTYTPLHTHMHTRLSVPRVSTGAQTTTNVQFLLMDQVCHHVGAAWATLPVVLPVYSAIHPSPHHGFLLHLHACLYPTVCSSPLVSLKSLLKHGTDPVPTGLSYGFYPSCLVPNRSCSAQCLHTEQIDTYFCVLEVWREEMMNPTQTSPASHSSTCSCV